MAKQRRKMIGYSTCYCREGFRPGIVLDPFAGAGTTLVVARKLKRDFIGFDINPKYCEMARRRISAQKEGSLPHLDKVPGQFSLKR